MARDFLLSFTSFAGGAAIAHNAAQTSAALTIEPLVGSGKRNLLVRFNVGQTATAGSPTAIKWNFAVQMSKDNSTWTSTALNPSDAAALTSAVTTNVPGDASIQYFLEAIAPNAYTDASGVVQDNYKYIRVVATPTMTGGTSPTVNCTLSAAIVSGRDGAYS